MAMTDELGASLPLAVFSCLTCGSEGRTRFGGVAYRVIGLCMPSGSGGLADAAEVAERAGELSTALSSWNDALTLLPKESRQYAAIAARIAKLGRHVEAGPSRPKPSASSAAQKTGPEGAASSRWSGGAVWGVITTLGLVVWKIKFLGVLLLTKGKILLLGLTKASTFLSMLASVGLYWTIFGGWFALGLVLSIYVHEMGHVFALSRYGIHAGAPLFVPGLGAFIRLKQELTDPKQDARVGLAGPIWGLGAALVCLAAFVVTRQPIWAALAQFGAFINLFNLLPIWNLDGGRAFRSLTRSLLLAGRRCDRRCLDRHR